VSLNVCYVRLVQKVNKFRGNLKLSVIRLRDLRLSLTLRVGRILIWGCFEDFLALYTSEAANRLFNIKKFSLLKGPSPLNEADYYDEFDAPPMNAFPSYAYFWSSF